MTTDDDRVTWVRGETREAPRQLTSSRARPASSSAAPPPAVQRRTGAPFIRAKVSSNASRADRARSSAKP